MSGLKISRPWRMMQLENFSIYFKMCMQLYPMDLFRVVHKWTSMKGLLHDIFQTSNASLCSVSQNTDGASNGVERIPRAHVLIQTNRPSANFFCKQLISHSLVSCRLRVSVDGRDAAERQRNAFGKRSARSSEGHSPSDRRCRVLRSLRAPVPYPTLVAVLGEPTDVIRRVSAPSHHFCCFLLLQCFEPFALCFSLCQFSSRHAGCADVLPPCKVQT